MRPTRKLVLRTEPLAELTAGELGSVVGGNPTFNGCSLPVNQCLSMSPCMQTSPANCGDGTIVYIKTTATS